MCLGSRVLTGSKNAVNTSELMHDMVKKFPELIPKLQSIISDQAAYQLAANKRFSRMIGRNLQQLTCSLHTTSNGDVIFNGCLPLADESNHFVQLMFGSRQNWDHSDASLRSELEIGLQIECGRSFTPFKNKRGSRFAIGYSNAINLIKHRDLVLRVLETKKASKISYAAKLKQLLTSKWTQTCLQLGLYVIHWQKILCPFYSAMGKVIDLGSGKCFARELKDRYQSLLDSSNKFETMLGFVDDGLLEEYPCLRVVKQTWSTCEASDRDEVNRVLQAAVESTAKKIMKDTQLVIDLSGEPSELMPFSNNRCESTFSLIKVILIVSVVVIITVEFSIFIYGSSA